MASDVATEPGSPLLNSEDAPKALAVALDASTGAARVLAIAARLSRQFPDAPLHVIHVFRTSRWDRAPAGGSQQTGDPLAEAKEQLDYFVRSARSQCRNQVVGHFTIGDPTSEILRLTGELDVDLLVVGTHDHVGFERLLLGSVAETIVRKANASVLVVRPSRKS